MTDISSQTHHPDSLPSATALHYASGKVHYPIKNILWFVLFFVVFHFFVFFAEHYFEAEKRLNHYAEHFVKAIEDPIEDFLFLFKAFNQLSRVEKKNLSEHLENNHPEIMTFILADEHNRSAVVYKSNQTCPDDPQHLGSGIDKISVLNIEVPRADPPQNLAAKIHLCWPILIKKNNIAEIHGIKLEQAIIQHPEEISHLRTPLQQNAFRFLKSTTIPFSGKTLTLFFSTQINIVDILSEISYPILTLDVLLILLVLVIVVQKWKNNELYNSFLTEANHKMISMLNQNEYNYHHIKKKLEEYELGFDKSSLKMKVTTTWELVEINDNFCHFAQVKREEVLYKKITFFTKGISEKFSFESIEKGLLHGNSWRGEVHLLCPEDGVDRWGIFTIIPFVNEADIIYQFIIIGFNITEKRLTENRLKILSSYDDLTELPNRRSFDQVMEREWLRMKRQKSHLSVIMIDVDFFKKYNDFYGHVGGDECLKKVARALQNTIRRSGDLIARFGGEEFAVILPNTDMNGALEVAEKLRWAVLQLKIPHLKSEVERYVTISAGVSTTIPGNSNTILLLIETADEALYWAKSQGRNTSRLKVAPSDLDDSQALNK